MRLAAAALVALACGAAAADPTTPCRVPGLKNEVRCGSVARPLDPARPGGVNIDVHYVVVPATARRRLADPVFLLAGGPGQSAIDVAPAMLPLLARLNNRRDLVFVDQRGTGRSAPLPCDTPRGAPLAEQSDPARMPARLRACREQLAKLPHGDLRFYTTALAVDDLDAVRNALGAERINLVGASYGTRVALELLRRHPQTVRRAVLDGVVPPDMALPASFSTDNQAAFDALAEASPGLRRDWDALLATLPRQVGVAHPLTGRPETLTLTRDALLGAVRGPLYVPALASALPQAIADAAGGRFEPLFGLAATLGGDRGPKIAIGMHFSVVCAEDVPRMDAVADRPGADFADSFGTLYRQVCADWPRGEVQAAFYTLAPAAAPVLLASGGIDPATPPRHAERVARALGANAVQVVVPNAGHGVLGLGCMRDVLWRFVDAADDAQARAVDASCAQRIPRPPAFRLPQPAP
jgi:pimeloyl-ACP methyl ester carboxylesterase